MLIGGAGLTLIGSAILIVEGRGDTTARDRRAGRDALADRVVAYVARYRKSFAMGGLLIGLSTFQAEFDFGVPQFQFVLEPIMLAFAAGVALVAARIWIGPGAALGAALLLHRRPRRDRADRRRRLRPDDAAHAALSRRGALRRARRVRDLAAPRLRVRRLRRRADRLRRDARRVRLVARLDADPVALEPDRRGDRARRSSTGDRRPACSAPTSAARSPPPARAASASRPRRWSAGRARDGRRSSPRRPEHRRHDAERLERRVTLADVRSGPERTVNATVQPRPAHDRRGRLLAAGDRLAGRRARRRPAQRGLAGRL